ncbi:MAG TPA: D-sedoheptulose 7-phosphate isomerase [Bacteroidales bacterium]|nr:D-sedoheptulose 7-phosphate isomerase [Bacteroidales bacterium]
MINQIIQNDLQEAMQMLNLFMNDEKNFSEIGQAAMLMAEALKTGNKVISCGNGGSMCDAMHFAEELTGRYRNSRTSLPAIALSDPAHITCTANDFGYEYVFSRSIESLGKTGDVLLAFSSSGNSANIIEAAKAAKGKGIIVIGMTGKTGGKLSSLCDVEIRTPESQYADRVQEIHIKVVHIMLNIVEQLLGISK